MRFSKLAFHLETAVPDSAALDRKVDIVPALVGRCPFLYGILAEADAVGTLIEHLDQAQSSCSSLTDALSPAPLGRG